MKSSNRVALRGDYDNIRITLGSKGDHERATGSFSKGKEIVQELEEKTGYHYPLADRVEEQLSHYRKKVLEN